MRMRVFISWSGERSKQIAQALHDWIPQLNHLLEPWLSSSAIQPGNVWITDLMEGLKATDRSIVCLTPENVESLWVNFEAGALLKDADRSRLGVYLFGLDAHALEGRPLAAFQASSADKEGTFGLLLTLNHALGQDAKPDLQFRRDFEEKWPHFAKQLPQVNTRPTKDEWTRSLWVSRLFQQASSYFQAAFEENRRPIVAILDINALAPLHPGFEMFLELLRKGGELRILVMDPDSQAFRDRSALETDAVGRIAAELMASIYIVGDMVDHLKKEGTSPKCELRLTQQVPDGAMFLVDEHTQHGIILTNPYPKGPGQRGLSVPWYTWKASDPVLYGQYGRVFQDLWKNGTQITLASPLTPSRERPFVRETPQRPRGGNL